MFDIFIMNMGGHDENVKQILSKLPHAQSMRYINSHLDMIKKAVNKSKTEFVWIISSCCDYTNFNFDYITLPWEKDFLHCWASGTQKFGDTFLVNVQAFKNQSNIEKLDWYQHIYWHNDPVDRLQWSVNNSINDHINKIKNHRFNSIYEYFTISNCDDLPKFDPILWADRNLITFNNGSVILVPQDIKAQINSQLYDYKNIYRVTTNNMKEIENDIVFISYDELNAEENYLILKNKFSRTKRIHGVSGMLTALKEAANIVDTPYFYAVFAKTKVDDKFQFNFQPDYLKEKSNYVFQAYNPVLDHSYGHGSIVLYNTEWLRTVESYDLDLTMSLPIVSIPVLSCTNNFTETPWSAWRTSFRETYKLFNKENKSIEDEYHLHLWLTSDNGINGKWSQLGANHATKVKINSTKLNDWEWLKKEFNQCYEQNQ